MSFDSFFDALDDVMTAPMPVHTEEELRRAAYERAAEEYSRKFNEAYEAREIRRASERAQWQNLILPHIRQEGILRRQERGCMTA